jgi:ABC-type polysaccharide/polyol phosphate export permease
MSSAITEKYDLLSSKKIDPNIFIWSKFLFSFWIHLVEATLVMFILLFLGYYNIFMYLLILPLYALFVFGVGKILCVLSTKVFDIVHIWNYFCQLLWFVTPVYFLVGSEDLVTTYNPLVYFIDLARYVSYGFGNSSVSLFMTPVLLSFAFYLSSQILFFTQKKYLNERTK